MPDEARRDVSIRPYDQNDEPKVLALLGDSLGWLPDAQHSDFFRWKHFENPFGRSPAWVALDGDRIVGLRILMRWDFTRDGVNVPAVRAVDTATHPEYQGAGIFSRLTRHALEELRKDAIAFVFNTPNEKSRPGYLKLGWQLVARLPVLARARSPRSLLAIARARVPAEKWSQPTSAGISAAEALRDTAALRDLLATDTQRIDRQGVVRTHVSPEFYAWRYGFGPLGYRVMLVGDHVTDGFVVFRLRRRGAALEAALCDVVVPHEARRQVARLLRDVLRDSAADYAVRIGGAHTARAGFVPLPGQGPTLAWRSVTETTMPPSNAWNLVLGDVELF